MYAAAMEKTETYRHVLLAPADEGLPTALRSNLCGHQAIRQRLLTDMQRLRGRVYVRDGALPESSLTADGRHVSLLDGKSWHLLTVDRAGEVAGCARMLLHRQGAGFDDLFVAGSSLAQSTEWGQAVRNSVGQELSLARRSGVAFFEAGGWALREDLRHSTQAARLALGVYAFAQLIGGAIVLTTATLRNSSASILRRLGGRALKYRGTELPVYFDPQYGCEMAILRFDSESFTPKYAQAIQNLRLELQCVPVMYALEGGHVSTATAAPRRRLMIEEQSPNWSLAGFAGHSMFADRQYAAPSRKL